MTTKEEYQKQLIIGHDYAEIFGLDPDKGQHMIYNGGISWTAKKTLKSGEIQEMTRDSELTTDNALAYINQIIEDPRDNYGYVGGIRRR
jgi:hypothetical protein